MGTPGDKRTLEKIVGTEHNLEPETDTVPSTEQPSTSATFEPSEMGVLSRLPDFHLLTGPAEPVPHLSNKPESFQQTLEQASIEDYFTQTKYYTGTSESFTTLYPVAPPTTFQALDQPGPSGVQTVKDRTGSERAKKKKQERAGHKRNHPCPICHKSFATGENFDKHYQTHTTSHSTPQFKCELCKKSFSSKFKLVRHALIHSDKKPFSCTVCDRTFHRKDHLKNHIKVHSPTKKLYECNKPDCNKQYTSMLSYKKHLAVHAADEGNLTCQICYANFENKDGILYHLKIHAGSRTIKNPNEKKYLCDYCERRFFTKKDVRRHLVVHTGMRDFLCQFCPQRFGRKDHLVRHIKKSHHRQYSEEALTQIKLEVSKPETITTDVPQDIPISETVYSEASFSSLQDMPSTSGGWVKPSEVKLEQVEGSILGSGVSFKEEDLGLEGVKTIFEEESLRPLNEDELFLSSQSTPSELKQFCTDMLKQIGDEPPSSSSQVLLEPSEPEPGESHEAIIVPEEEILDPEMFSILEQADDNKLPLPGFSQTFQPPPPP